MGNIYTLLMQWSEVWPILISLTIFLTFRPEGNALKILFAYACMAFMLNLLSTLLWLHPDLFPKDFFSNNILYNINSVLRVIFPCIYILSLKGMKPYKYLPWLLSLFIIAVIINFLFFENFYSLSTRLLSAESIIMLIFSVTFLLNLIVEEDTELSTELPALLACAGIGLYESVNFFYYLFFYHALDENRSFAYRLFDVARYSIIIYWLFFGFTFYYSSRKVNPQPGKALIAHEK